MGKTFKDHPEHPAPAQVREFFLQRGLSRHVANARVHNLVAFYEGGKVLCEEIALEDALAIAQSEGRR